MKIAMYKPYKKVFFTSNTVDLGGWSNECTQLSRLLRDRGHEVVWLSPTDLYEIPMLEYENRWHAIENYDLDLGYQDYDRVFVIAGRFDVRNEKSETDLKRILSWRFQSKCSIDFFHTDIDLIPSKGTHSQFNHWYCQANPKSLASSIVSRKVETIDHVPLYTLPVYGSRLNRDEMIDRVLKKWRDRGVKGFLYGGSERDRLDLFLEYVYRPDYEWYGDFPSLQIDNRVPQSSFLEKLAKATWSIVFSNHYAHGVNHVTPKPWENLVSGVLSFIDIRYDKLGYVFSYKDDCRVGGYLDVLEKLFEIEKQQSIESTVPDDNLEMDFENLFDEDVVSRWFSNQWDTLHKSEFINGDKLAACLNV